MVAALFMVVVAPLVAQSPMREGLWEVTLEPEGAGVPVSDPGLTQLLATMKSTRCITPDQAQAPGSVVFKGPGPDKSCQVTDQKMDGNRLTWKLSCAGVLKIAGDGAAIFSGDSYISKLNMTVEMTGKTRPMTLKYTGTRVGDCPK
jgi:hypothetical protein